jgi:hypothetical protein
MSKRSEDYREAAREAMEQAKTLMGEGTMSDREFLESMARADELVDHEDDCGHCGMQIIQAQTARDLLAEGEILDGISKWVAEHRRRWQETKYFKLYQREKAAGRDPQKAFAKRGWEM